MTETMEHPWAVNAHGFDGTIATYNAFLEQMFPGEGYAIDELALMFHCPAEALAFCSQAVKEDGVVMFNSAFDNVKTSPIPSNYSVFYAFLANANTEYRLECMALTGGISPLHSTVSSRIAEVEGDVPPSVAVHVSFKCRNEANYEHVVAALQNAPEATLAQRCDSDYGRFSYFMIDDFWEWSAIYLKPRVNIRDA